MCCYYRGGAYFMQFLVQNNLEKRGTPIHVVYFFLFFFVYFIVNVTLFSRSGPHWDEILDWQGGATDTYLVAGRWGTYLYRVILGQGAMPWFAGIMAGVYISAAIVLQAKLLKLTVPALGVLYAGLYVACNQWQSQLVYSFQCDSVALGLLFATLSVFVLVNKGRCLLSAVFLTLSLSSYQTNGIYWFVLFVSVILMQNVIQKRTIINAGVVAVVGMLFYFSVQKICMAVAPISSETVAYVQGYQKTTSNWQHMPNYPLSLQLLGIAHYFKRAVLHALGCGESFSLAASTAIIPAVLLIFRYVRREIQNLEKIVRVILVIAVWFAPYALTFVMLGFLGDRVALAAPVSLASLWLLWLRECSLSPKLISVIGVAVFVLLVNAGYNNCVKSRNGNRIHELAVRQLFDMYGHARRTAHDNKMDDFQIVLAFDNSCTVQPEESMFPRYLTDGVLDWYTEHYKLHGMRIARDEEMSEYRESLRALPFWPDLRSMVIRKDKIVIRIPMVAR